jgi:hypothetical protein
MNRNATRTSTILTAVAVAIITLSLVPVALGKGKPGGGGGGGGGGGTTTCTQSAPGIAVQNNWAWGQTGSWGMPGQQLGYQVQVINNDVGCGSSSFSLSVSAPDGFAASVPTSTVSLNSSSSTNVEAYATSPSGISDGNYPLTVTVERAGTSGSATTYYKVYSADATAPTLFWTNPSDGQAISGSSFMVNVSSSDDHALKQIDFYLDGTYVTSRACDDITYICQLSYKLSLSHMSGQHTATFKSTDWMGNVGVSHVTFTVG